MTEGRDAHDRGGNHDQDVAAAGMADWSLGRLLSTAARLVELDWTEWLTAHELTHDRPLALHALQDGPIDQRQLAAANRGEEQTMSRGHRAAQFNQEVAADITKLLALASARFNQIRIDGR
jgi:hypothetical protein